MRTKPKARKKKQEAEVDQKAMAFEESIKAQVFEKLGRPKSLSRVTVTPCKNGCHARINIWCSVPIKKETGYFAVVRNTIFDSRVELTDTFYLQLSLEGGITHSEPRIERKY